MLSNVSKTWTENGETDSEYVVVVNNDCNFSGKRMLNTSIYDTLDCEVFLRKWGLAISPS